MRGHLHTNKRNKWHITRISTHDVLYLQSRQTFKQNAWGYICFRLATFAFLLSMTHKVCNEWASVPQCMPCIRCRCVLTNMSVSNYVPCWVTFQIKTITKQIKLVSPATWVHAISRLAWTPMRLSCYLRACNEWSVLWLSLSTKQTFFRKFLAL